MFITWFGKGAGGGGDVEKMIYLIGRDVSIRPCSDFRRLKITFKIKATSDL